MKIDWKPGPPTSVGLHLVYDTVWMERGDVSLSNIRVIDIPQCDVDDPDPDWSFHCKISGSALPVMAPEDGYYLVRLRNGAVFRTRVIGENILSLETGLRYKWWEAAHFQKMDPELFG